MEMPLALLGKELNPRDPDKHRRRESQLEVNLPMKAHTRTAMGRLYLCHMRGQSFRD